jgi:hypothetical protein
MAPTLTTQTLKMKRKNGSYHTHLEIFWLWHIAHSTTGTRNISSVATYYVEETKEAKTYMINNIT